MGAGVVSRLAITSKNKIINVVLIWAGRTIALLDYHRNHKEYPMAKKNRRVTTSVSVASSASSVNRGTEFNPDYTYIKRDLGRIGVLAGSFFAILIVLSFFIK